MLAGSKGSGWARGRTLPGSAAAVVSDELKEQLRPCPYVRGKGGVGVDLIMKVAKLRVEEFELTHNN